MVEIAESEIFRYRIQLMLFVMGVMLALGVVEETGVLGMAAAWMDHHVHNVWLIGAFSGLLSGVLDAFTVMMTGISMYPIVDGGDFGILADPSYMANFVQNGAFWKIMAYSTSIGGCLLCFSNPCGLALMKMERMHVGWYFKNCTLGVFIGWLLGLAILWAECFLLQ